MNQGCRRRKVAAGVDRCYEPEIGQVLRLTGMVLLNSYTELSESYEVSIRGFHY